MNASMNANNSWSQNIPNSPLKHQITFAEKPKPIVQRLNKSYDSSLREHSQSQNENVSHHSIGNSRNGRNTDFGFRSMENRQPMVVNENVPFNVSTEYPPGFLNYYMMFDNKQGVQVFSPEPAFQYTPVLNRRKFKRFPTKIGGQRKYLNSPYDKTKVCKNKEGARKTKVISKKIIFKNNFVSNYKGYHDKVAQFEKSTRLKNKRN